jgi:oligopeptide/dipeptide ABC transporter ATP-binding protein
MSGGLVVEGVRKTYQVRTKAGFWPTKGPLTAVNDVSFEIPDGGTFGLLGESGCGKSTLGRVILGTEPADRGTVVLDGKRLVTDWREAKRWRERVQMVFQDPYGSVSPRMRVDKILREPLDIHDVGPRRERDEATRALIEQVGLSPEHLLRYPHELSGGQRQRVVIARALAVRPELLVCDEPTSALDVSVQARILELFETLRADFGLSYLFISHDLGVVRRMADEIGVMYLGDLVERAPADELYRRPFHPYTHALMAAVPSLRGARRPRLPIRGELPSPLNRPSGCPFRTRCPLATERCTAEVPSLREVEPGRWAACHHAERAAERVELAAAGDA